MNDRRIDVIIPVYRPGKEFGILLRRLARQRNFSGRIIVMNTEEKFWNRQWEEEFPLLQVHHLRKEEFDHGGTRRKAAAFSDGDILVFMTQDAIPADRDLIGNLVRPILDGEDIGASYAHQLPREDCALLERYTRMFNYPSESCVKRAGDVPVYGIKTYFCSNVCAAYERKAYEEAGGFPERAIFNEDMICAANMIRKGYGVAYAADARVFHSHNYSGRQQFHRNFDLGVSQAEHPEIFQAVSSEGEGLRLVRKCMKYLLRNGQAYRIPGLIFQSGCKYTGYILGKHFAGLPDFLIRKCTMNPEYWREK
ncbi:MAG: glycosyltransferase family 2 protein [Clostridiales bacterium]|nr:glycosyltransferase family 2 protein [Clostridiales bacterium]